MMVLSSPQYSLTIYFIISGVSSSQSGREFTVSPGKSTIVRSGHVSKQISQTTSSFYTFLPLPAILFCSLAIPYWISDKLVILQFGFDANTAYCPILAGQQCSQSRIGTRVQIPSPLGKTSCPTIELRTDDLPADYDPNTAILGSLILISLSHF